MERRIWGRGKSERVRLPSLEMTEAWKLELVGEAEEVGDLESRLQGLELQLLLADLAKEERPSG